MAMARVGAGKEESGRIRGTEITTPRFSTTTLIKNVIHSADVGPSPAYPAATGARVRVIFGR